MLRRAAVVAACSLALARPARLAAAPIADGDFVQVAGADFVVAGRPFAFVGANFEAVQGGRFRSRAAETIRALAADGLTVGRVWAFGEGLADADPWFRDDHLFRAGPDGYIEASYAQLDRVLVAARAAGVRLIVTLANQWEDYGGLPMYLRWAGLPADEALPFYRDPRIRGWYEAGVERLLERRNSVSGVRYADDPTILAWELMNESSVDEPAVADARYDWIAETARFIKARDSRHLVAAGLIGYGTRRERADWIRVHRLPEIDYCDSHLYPQAGDEVGSFSRLADLLDDRAQLARFVIGKPLVIGELGFRTDGAAARRWRGLTRAGWFARALDRARWDGIAGALAWIYQPFPASGAPRDFGIYTDSTRTDDVRRALARAAQIPVTAPVAAASQNPRLGPSRGDAPLYDPVLTVIGSRARPRRYARLPDGSLRLEIPPAEFVDARFERAGPWDRTALAHVYARGAGRIRYRFPAPPLAAGKRGARDGWAIELRARVSSEWPGTRAPADGGSLVEVWLDGERVALFEAEPDDGKGAIHEIRVRDRALARRLTAAGPHTLELRVPDGPRANGLCVYGLPTGRGDPGALEAIPIQIFYRPEEGTR